VYTEQFFFRRKILVKKERENLFVSKETSYFTDKILPPIGRVAQQDRRKAGRSESGALESGLAKKSWSRKSKKKIKKAGLQKKNSCKPAF
jgi:hypothetical protein